MIVKFLLLLSPALLFLACGGDDDEGGLPAVEPTGRIIFTSNLEGNDDVFILEVESMSLENLTNEPESSDREASVSSAGDQIAFISTREGGINLWTMGIDGSNPEQVTNDAAVVARPEWSPDDSQIAYFSAIEQEKGFLWVVDLATGGMGPLLDVLSNEATTPCLGGTPTDWPEQDLIFYQGTQASIGATQLCTLQPSDFVTSLLVSIPDKTIFDGVRSPDASQIAYSSDELGNFDVWVADADGSNPNRLTFDPGVDSGPSWSPDGQWLAFASQRDGDYDIYIMRPDGSDLRKLTDNDVDDTLPDWTN
jgi:TolB protein